MAHGYARKRAGIKEYTRRDVLMARAFGPSGETGRPGDDTFSADGLARPWLDGAVEIAITDVAEKERFEARDAAGALAGFVTYQLTGNIIVYTHTTVVPAHQGEGIAGQLARFVMDDARERHRTVVPICPYISEWLDKHSEYADVVARTTKKVK